MRGKPLNQNLAAARLAFALEVVEDYEANRPKGVYPHYSKLARGIDDWPVASLCFSGLEQAFKLLIRERHGDKEAQKLNGHELACLFASLPSTDQEKVESYYRVYRSFNRFTRPPKEFKTAEQFVKAISDDYTAWRYTLIENQSHPPKIYVHFMLEIWRSLLHLGGKSWCGGVDFLRIDKRIENYFELVLRQADHEWIQLCAEKNTATETQMPVIDWVTKERAGFLDAGLHVFRHLEAPSRFSLDPKVEEFQDHLLKAAKEVVVRLAAHERLWNTGILYDGTRDQRWEEIKWAIRMCLNGLSWNARDELFEDGKGDQEPTL